ncbi:MAG: hypothetical protein WC959_12155 [Kiritimatiellales bacterium]
MKYFSPALISLILMLAGCNENGAKRDVADEQDPCVRAGLEQVYLKNWDAAISKFKAALEKNPALARPDLELALINHQQKKNYINAIFYYERYLEKRPATEKRPLILDWIRQSKVLLAGEIAKSSDGVSEELVRLRRENNLLREQLKAFEGETAPAPVVANVKTIPGAALESPVQTATLAPAAAEKPVEQSSAPAVSSANFQPAIGNQPPPALPARMYKVNPGDTLMRISRDVYGDSSKWRKIFDANRDKMRHEADLKIGQLIAIPD